jgi:hypothetical protein
LFQFNGSLWTDKLKLQPSLAQRRETGRSVGVVDRKGQGKYSMLVVNYNAPISVVEQDGTNNLVNNAQAAGLSTHAGASRSIVCAPLTSDKVDVVIGNENGPNMIFVDTGNGIYKESSAQVRFGDPKHNARGLAVIQNYEGRKSQGNHDVSLGVLVGNDDGGSRMFVYSSGAKPGFVAGAISEMESIREIRNILVADFDNDGFDEIFFNNLGVENVLLSYRNNDWVRVPLGAAKEPESSGTSAVVGDFNGDGILELIIGHGETRPQSLSAYSLLPNSFSWIRIFPVTRFGAPARGAKVVLQQLDRSQVKVIDSGSGYMCQQEPVAHFGLGLDPHVVQVTIRWPDGASKTISGSDLKVNTQIRVPHPNTEQR